MPPRRTNIQLDAPCLRASRQNLRVAMIQPGSRLTFSAEQGVHYDDQDQVMANARANGFLDLVMQSDTELAIAPEYFLPMSTLLEIIADPSRIRRDTLYVLPLESSEVQTIHSLQASPGATNWEIRTADYRNNSSGRFFNSCAIIFATQANLMLFIQHKVFFSPIEEDGLIEGNEVFVFQGNETAIMTLICSDANERSYHSSWAQAAASKTGFFLIHPQWNPRPDFEEYRSLWESILNKEQGEHRILISLNWASGSTIQGCEENPVLVKPRTRLLRGRRKLDPANYGDRSRKGLHLQGLSAGSIGTWEVWHWLHRSEGVLVVNLVRPYQNVHSSLLHRKLTIKSAQCFKHQPTDNGFLESNLELLVRPFWDMLVERGVSREAFASILDLPLSELEEFCDSCLALTRGSGFVRDVSERIPTAVLFCPTQGCTACADRRTSCTNRREEWEEVVEDLAQCLNVFWDSSARTTHQLTVSFPEEYPLNLSRPGQTGTGWLFHAKGKNARRLTKLIARFLGKKLSDHRATILLKVVGADGDLPHEDEIAGDHEITEDRDHPHSVLNPKGRARLKFII